MTHTTVTVTARIDVTLLRGQNNREHHRVRALRVAAERKATLDALWSADMGYQFGDLEQARREPGFAARVTLTRPYQVTPLDCDNLSASLKAVRDAVARYVRLDDASDRLHWVYRQEPAVVVGKSTKPGKTRASPDRDTRPTVTVEVMDVEDIDPNVRAIRVLRAFATVVERFSVHTHDENGVGCLLCLSSRVLADTNDQWSRAMRSWR